MMPSTLLNKCELLLQIIHESPYLSRDYRKAIEEDIHSLTEKLKSELVSIAHAEKELMDLFKRAAHHEIDSLMTKIFHLNPSSPRLQALGLLAIQLKQDEISPEQARINLHHMMNGS